MSHIKIDPTIIEPTHFDFPELNAVDTGTLLLLAFCIYKIVAMLAR